MSVRTSCAFLFSILMILLMPGRYVVEDIDEYVVVVVNGPARVCVVDGKESSKEVEGSSRLEDVLSSIFRLYAPPQILAKLWQFSDNEADIRYS